MRRGPAWMRGSAIAVLVTALGGCREATTPEFSRLVSGMCAQPAPLLGTADPAIFAAGDVANAHHPFLRRHIRVEHWANAQRQPAVAALSMMGRPASYDRLPYF